MYLQPLKVADWEDDKYRTDKKVKKKKKKEGLEGWLGIVFQLLVD